VPRGNVESLGQKVRRKDQKNRNCQEFEVPEKLYHDVRVFVILV
jgi:hypothetical protein